MTSNLSKKQIGRGVTTDKVSQTIHVNSCKRKRRKTSLPGDGDIWNQSVGGRVMGVAWKPQLSDWKDTLAPTLNQIARMSLALAHR